MTDFNVDNPIIKQFLALPDRVEALEKRVDVLEQQANNPTVPVEPPSTKGEE